MAITRTGAMSAANEAASRRSNEGAEPNRRRVADWRIARSLQAGLTLLVAVTVAAVIGAVTYAEIRLFESGVERDLRDVARSAATAISDDIELRTEPLDGAAIARMLHEFIDATPVLRTITVVRADPEGWRAVASTSSLELGSDVVRLAREAVERQEAVWSEAVPMLPRVAVPIKRGDQPFGATVVTVSLASVEQIRARGRLVALAAAVLAVGTVTGLIHLLMRRYVHGPIGAIKAVMDRAARGDLAARVAVQRDDELGIIARQLNHMLDEMQGFHRALQERVSEATEELRRRNIELAESFDRLLALREALARAEQLAAVGHLAANVAHQIATPLNLISGYVQMSLEEPGLDPRLARRLQTIQEQISILTTIVRTLLDRTRRSGERERVDAAELVRRVCEFARPRLEAGAVRLELELPAAPLPLDVDRAQLELALLHIIVNAVEAMAQGGDLRVTVRETDTAAVIEVHDTGPGIPPDLLPRIFEPWVTTKPPGRGTGLGLSITRDVVTSHGGVIRARNRLDGGASFVVELPRAPAAVVGP